MKSDSLIFTLDECVADAKGLGAYDMCWEQGRPVAGLPRCSYTYLHYHTNGGRMELLSLVIWYVCVC